MKNAPVGRVGILFVALGNVTKGIVLPIATAGKTRQTAAMMGNVAAGSVTLTVTTNIAFAVPRGESLARNTSHESWETAKKNSDLLPYQ